MLWDILLNFSEYQEGYPSSFTANYDGYVPGAAAGLMLGSPELIVMDYLLNLLVFMVPSMKLKVMLFTIFNH